MRSSKWPFTFTLTGGAVIAAAVGLEPTRVFAPRTASIWRRCRSLSRC